MNYSSVYGSEELKALIKDSENNIRESNSELKSETYLNATVLPFAEPENMSEAEKIDTINRIGGVFDDKLNLVELSKVKAGENKLRVGRPEHYSPAGEIRYIDEDVVFIGYLTPHFGHFLVESLNRVWIYLNGEHKEKKAVYIAPIDTPFIDIFVLFGLNRDNIVRVAETTKFRSVTIPESTTLMADSVFHSKQNDVFMKIRNDLEGRGFDKIYLSRTRYKGEAHIYGEEIVEKVFADNGFRIIHPEQLSIMEQIALIKDCNHIAGVAGSALHLSVFAKNDVELTCLNRSKDSFSFQLIINRMKNIRYNCIEAYFPYFPALSYRYPYLLSQNGYLKDYCRNQSFEVDENLKITVDEFFHYLEDWLFVAGQSGDRELSADGLISIEELKTYILGMIDTVDLRACRQIRLLCLSHFSWSKSEAYSLSWQFSLYFLP